jgi:predicted regulator of Ras-like GTPase activity (Roadblock/LC7/MglB family)
LQEIPKQPELNLDEIPVGINQVAQNEYDIKSKNETEQLLEEEKSQVLQEITPKPFQSPILSSSKDTISDAFSELKQSVLDGGEEKSKPTLVPIPTKPQENTESVSKQKRLEKDMTDVLSFLSKKISVKKLDSEVPPPAKTEPEKKIPPASMNEILNELITLDSRIEASAIIKTDGTMLASAISSRISESLFSTIGMNLSMIGTDIIHGISAGALKSISVKGSDGILDLAPIDTESPNLKDMILILFSHPNVKSGIISIAINVIKKQIKYYMGLEK